MERRKLFQALSLIAVAPAAKALPIGGKHYIMFCDAQAVDVNGLASREFPNLPPDAIVEIVPMRLRDGQTIDEALRIYEIEGWR